MKISTPVGGNLATLALLLLFLVLLLPLTRPFPYSDDWGYIYALSSGSWADLGYLFGLHNDHRIPLQKALHLLLLKISGGDFRALVAVNVMVCAATSLLWIRVLRATGQVPFWVEWCIPAIVLTWGLNNVAWAFSFSFASGFFFVSLATYLAVVRDIYSGEGVVAVFAALILAGLCGASGLVGSLVLGIGITSLLVVSRPYVFKKASCVAAVAAWALVVSWLLIGWRPSEATGTGFATARDLAVFFNGITAAWLGVYASTLPPIKWMLSAVLVGVTAYLSVRQLKHYSREPERQVIALRSFPVFLVMLQAVLVAVAVSFSRAKVQPWFPGLELHYGHLTIAIPLAAIVMLTRLSNYLARNALFLGLALIVGTASVSNTVWRIDVARGEYQRSIAAANDILSQLPADVVASRHIKEFYWISGASAENAVADGISKLRTMGIWRPR